MRRSVLLISLLVIPALTRAQAPAPADATCESKCNQQASECLKVCSGDPKDANKPGQAQKMMQCLQKCEKETQPCRDACKKR